jgi:acetoacetyl-CoA synthetase
MDPQPVLTIQAPLYTPSPSTDAQTHRFRLSVNHKFGLHLANYFQLYQWSCQNPHLFWSTVWHFDHPILGTIPENSPPCVDSSATPDENPPWFPGATLNWAENMLRFRSPNKLALVQASKTLECMSSCANLISLPFENS